MKQRVTIKIMASIVAVVMFALAPSEGAGAVQKPTAKKTSFSESELRALAKAVPDVKNAGQLYSVALATTNDVDWQQAYLRASAAGLIACGKTDVYKKYVKGKLQNVAEFEDGLKDDCKQCSGNGTKDQRCLTCRGNGKCLSCKGTGQIMILFDKQSKPCRRCNEGRCSKCDGQGSTMEKCFACAGTGKVFSKSVAARVFRDSCNAIADGMGMMVKPEVAAGPEEEKEERKDVAESRTTRRRRRGPEPEERNGTEQGDVKEVSIAENSLAVLDEQDSYHKRNNSKSAERSNVEPLKPDLGGEQKDRWLRQIFDLAQSPAANDDTINFYGFFPGMSRHDAQVLAEYYNLDGDECRIYTVGEKGVYSITLDIKAVARILKTVSRVLKTDVAVGTYEEIAQAVANAVGDLQSKGTRTVTGERWGDRTYFDEHVSQWYERASVDGTYLKLARNGMAITGNKNLMSRMPVETASAKSQRLETTKTVIQNLLNSMVDVPVKFSGLKPFKMSKCEVTQLQWTHVMGNNPSEHMSSQIGSRNSGDCPVDDVSWDDCQEFLKEFNALPEVKKTGLTFRLPTVEEWEYACRAGASDGVCKLANGRKIFKARIDEVAWIEVADGIMRPVGLKTPNAFGMFDLIGNASEWTCSWDKEYKDRCIVIGGSCNSQWNDDSDKKLWRDSKRSDYKSGKLGFRLCASKYNGDGPGTGMRKFGASYKIGDESGMRSGRRGSRSER